MGGNAMKILKGGRLIDGTGAAPVDGATIVLRDNRIAAVTTRNQSDWPEDAEIIDVSGKTVLPGLIDCHDHMANHRYSLEHRWRLDEPQSTRHLRTAAVLKQTLAAGYTMIRDAAGLDAGFRRAIDEGLIEGPRLVLSLSIISPIGGIGDAVSPSGLPLDDCCCIPGDPLLPESVVNSLADEAHALDRRVMCHALGGRGLDLAIEAGVDSIEHGCYLDEDPRHLERMAERGIFFVPTLLVYEYHRKSPQPHVRERAQALVEHHVASIKRALSMGVKVVAGTDAGGHGHPANAGELVCLVEAGMTPMQALQAATGWAAECLGQEADLGTVEPGKLADLVVVAGDPLADIGGLRDADKIRLVLKGGEI